MEPFLLNALAGGLGMALMCGPLGCFIAWLRLAYFGEAIGHAALLGVALGLFFQLDTTLGIVFSALAMALALAMLTRGATTATDTAIGVLAQGALSLGVVCVALMRYPLDIQALLFGDILTLTRADALMLLGVAACVLAALTMNWRALVLMAASRDIAQAEGVRVARLRLLLLFLIALVVAVSIKAVGMLLIVSMLIVPAAAARPFARTPHGMAMLAMLAGALSVAGGLYASWIADTPSGPSIVLVALSLFMAGRMVKRR